MAHKYKDTHSLSYLPKHALQQISLAPPSMMLQCRWWYPVDHLLGCLCVCSCLSYRYNANDNAFTSVAASLRWQRRFFIFSEAQRTLYYFKSAEDVSKGGQPRGMVSHKQR